MNKGIQISKSFLTVQKHEYKLEKDLKVDTIPCSTDAV